MKRVHYEQSISDGGTISNDKSCTKWEEIELKIVAKYSKFNKNYKPTDPRSSTHPKKNRYFFSLIHIILKWLKTSNKEKLLKTFNEKYTPI